MISAKQFQRKLLNWFDQHGRKQLPWQQNKTPYRVWVSEIMLQQTQVATVIPYYHTFMETFPDLKSLARASEDDVLRLWAGLGYYSRARNLHRAAKMVVDLYQGIFPSDLAGLQSLPGIGQSTAGAILALAYETRATILDGNVKRVLARFYGIREPVNEKNGEQMLWEFADKLTPSQRVADYTQAMMDMGATLCTRSKPDCERCPFKSDCVAHQNKLSAILPVKKAAKPLPVKSATFLFIQQKEQIYLEKRPDKGIWGGLWSVPEIVGEPNQQSIQQLCAGELGFKQLDVQHMPAFRHTFTHYHLEIHPVLISVSTKRSKHLEQRPQIWYNLRHPTSVGLPRPIQTILRALS